MQKNHPTAFDLTEEDLQYAGSRYSDVRNAIFANPYQKTWGNETDSALPIYDVTLSSLIGGILPFGKPSQFLKATTRTVDARTDLRWGPDHKGQRRLLHPNGICLTGMWEITEQTSYSGYFKKGSQALTIARYSTCCNETRRGYVRSLALAAKLYPTTNPDHAETLFPANFFTQQDLGGDTTDFINDAELRNAPDTTAWRRGTGLPVFLLEGFLFLRADKEPAHRQLYQIAELDKAADESTQTPEFMRLRVVPEQLRIEGTGLDFRDEIMAQIYDPGESTPKRSLSFTIDVSDSGRTEGPPAMQRRIISHWRTIGKLTFKEAVVSYNGDHVLQFNHPTWRDDRNNPATATRIGGRKVR
ncbi:MAG: hypothetical protein HOP23_11665 [Methylococcaceae bacterium]|nr:hypothetical protein [Methylococcaceae bacterium]